MFKTVVYFICLVALWTGSFSTAEAKLTRQQVDENISSISSDLTINYIVSRDIYIEGYTLDTHVKKRTNDFPRIVSPIFSVGYASQKVDLNNSTISKEVTIIINGEEIVVPGGKVNYKQQGKMSMVFADYGAKDSMKMAKIWDRLRKGNVSSITFQIELTTAEGKTYTFDRKLPPSYFSEWRQVLDEAFNTSP